MKTTGLVVLWLVYLFTQSGCDITFKRKSTNALSAKQIKNNNKKEKKKISDKNNIKKQEKNITSKQKHTDFLKQDIKIILSYYKGEAHKKILSDMAKHTWVSPSQAKKLVVKRYIPRDIQIMPLPLELEGKLSPLKKNKIRIQVGKRLIIMNIKTRVILDMIKL